MQRRILFCLACLTVCGALNVPAAAFATEVIPRPLPADGKWNNAAAAQVLEFFQTEKFLGKIQAAFDTALAKRGKEIKISDTEQQLLGSLSRRIYRGKNLATSFTRAYVKAIPTQNLSALLDWMETPAGIKLHQAFSAAFSATPAELAAYYKTEGAVIIKPNRRNALTTFARLWHQGDQDASLRAGAEYGVLLGLEGFKPATARELEHSIHEKCALHKPAYATAAAEELFVFDAYLFKELKNAEIDEYTQFAQSVPGGAHSRAYDRALEVTLSAAGATLQDQVIKNNK